MPANKFVRSTNPLPLHHPHRLKPDRNPAHPAVVNPPNFRATP